MEYYGYYPSPVGKLLLTCGEDGLTGLWMDCRTPEQGVQDEAHPVLVQAKEWLDGYFRGNIPAVSVPLAPKGTVFQQKVWKSLLTIPYGCSKSYGDIAKELAQQLGKEKMSAQAVGQAVGRNPISIIIPCHRVVGARGQLTGYAGGLEKKKWLLQHEGWHIQENRIL